MPILTGGNVIDGGNIARCAWQACQAPARARCRPSRLAARRPAARSPSPLKASTTAAISWSATNSTLVANIDAALEALPGISALAA